MCIRDRQRTASKATLVMGAAGTMPGELHKIWDAPQGGYHMEYGFSCMGYEIAGAMGIKMARPAADVICMVGDGSYMTVSYTHLDVYKRQTSAASAASGTARVLEPKHDHDPFDRRASHGALAFRADDRRG